MRHLIYRLRAWITQKPNPKRALAYFNAASAEIAALQADGFDVSWTLTPNTRGGQPSGFVVQIDMARGFSIGGQSGRRPVNDVV